MAHFAKLGINGKVIAVHRLDNSEMMNADNLEDETVGQQRLEQIHGWPAQLWIQTSINTRGGIHYDANGDESADQSKALRGNYAGIGYTWDENNEIFWLKKPYDSWTKNTSTANWQSPITYPSIVNDGADPVVWIYEISWNEDRHQSDNTKGWEAVKRNIDGTIHADVDKTYDWNGSAWVERV